jgi:ABC-type polar amino acid transport system ATPase subunit
MTTPISTHEMGFTRSCDRVIVFADAAHEQGPPEEIFTAPKKERI